MKIGIVLDPQLGQTTGGSFSYYQTLLQAIDRHAFSPAIELCYLAFDHPVALDLQHPVVALSSHRLSRREQWKDRLNKGLKKTRPVARLFAGLEKKLDRSFAHFSALSLAAQLQAAGIDLLYYLRPAAPAVDYPYIMTHWDNGHRSLHAFPEVAMNRSFENREDHYSTVLGKAFAVFCESESGRGELLHFSRLKKEKIFVVPLFPSAMVGLNLPATAVEACLEPFGLNGAPFFFYPAQFWSHKNHYNLLVAFDRLRRQHPGVKLVLTGSDKGNLGYIRDLISGWDLTGQVLLTGFVADEVIYSLYKKAAALVMPTFLGPTNMPLLEAEAIGCPVICSDLPGHREMLGERAMYFAPHQPEALLACMQQTLVSEPGRLPHSNPVFNITQALQQMEQHFLDLLPLRKTFGLNFHQY